MDASASTSEAGDLANAMYWGSDESVNHIADALDLSKGALYALIRPAGAGRGCPRCGVEVVHSNRTAKERALVDCPKCGWEGSEAETAAVSPSANGASAAEAAPEAGTRPGRAQQRPSPSPDLDDTPPVPRLPGRGPGPAVIGGALLGAAAGVALLLWSRRR